MVRDAVRSSSAQRRFLVRDRSEVESFLRALGSLEIVLQELEDCSESSVNQKLKDLISIARQINKHRRLPAILRAIPNRQLGPNEREDFLTRLGELGRYLELSKHLCQTAKNNALFRNVEVIDVLLGDLYFARGRCPQQFSSLDDCLQRCVHGERDAESLCQPHGMTVSGATKQLNGMARKGVTESKIHAEIQIAAYYEINPTDLPPRIICSNKDACYLCNEFIKLQGKYYIPKSHGKLYPGWRVPPLRVFDETLAQLIRALESKIDSHHHNVVHIGRSRVPGPKDWSEHANVHFSDSMSTLPSLLSSESLKLDSQDSLAEDQGGKPNIQLPATQGFEPSLPTIAEIPARLPTPDDSLDSDASTVKPDDDRKALDVGEDWVPEQPMDTSRCHEEDVESIHAVDNSISEDTTRVIDKGKGRADDDEEDSVSVHDGRNNGEPHRDEAVAGGTPGTLGEQGNSGKETANVRSDNTQSLDGSHPGENILDTSSEEPEAREMELGERRRSKQPAETLCEQENDQDKDSVDFPTVSPIKLSKGVVVVCQLTNGNAIPWFTTGSLTVIPEFVRSDRSGGRGGAGELHVEWLTDEEASATKGAQEVTDVRSMPANLDIDSGSANLVTLAYDTIIVRFHIIRS